MGLDIQELFTKMAEEKPADSGRRDAVRDLARSWSRDPAMLEWMAQRSEFKCEAFVRQLAEQEISLSDEVMGGTLIWLMRRALFDAHERVRRDALVEIMRVWGHRPKVKTWVVERTEGKENRHIRDTLLEHISKMEHLDDKTRHEAGRKLAISKASHARHRNLEAGLDSSSNATQPEQGPPDSPTGLLFSNN
ncbi:hypothetical protein [Pelodictyon luteolum]|uniref:HEAT repeat domain-containing protein n=1 Tax=Chlorobium luteolum (strain DSM 273 / BCRC 81028 / 2530) TaxID=319225 RepID=Q3B4N9_CHLL3|nr:hypothetical protein [Pelodictyon luteolum]ABB23692.1 hypothetical protein Plut_0823 [Pelodictyon luteolum DSM 273]